MKVADKEMEEPLAQMPSKIFLEDTQKLPNKIYETTIF